MWVHSRARPTGSMTDPLPPTTRAPPSPVGLPHRIHDWSATASPESTAWGREQRFRPAPVESRHALPSTPATHCMPERLSGTSSQLAIASCGSLSHGNPRLSFAIHHSLFDILLFISLFSRTSRERLHKNPGAYRAVITWRAADGTINSRVIHQR